MMNTVGTVPGNLPKGVEEILGLKGNAGFELRVVDLGAPRKPGLSLHAPGVSEWNGPSGPNFRSAKASPAVAMSRWCGGQ